jgi:branched-chain amino acid transport system substrate-binding protein
MKLSPKSLYILPAVLLAAAALWFFGNTSTKNEEVIKIGYFAPLTGPAAETSEQMINAFRLANEMNPEIYGRRIEVVYEDDGCDPKKAVVAAQKLINIDKVDILVSGVCSGSILAAAPIAEAAKIVLITPISSSPKITTAGDYIFRISGTAIQTADGVSGEVLNRLNLKRVGIVYENTEYVVGWKDSFKAKYSSLGGSVSSEEGFGTADADLRSQLTKLALQKPDAIVALANSAGSVNKILNQMNQLGIHIPVVGNEYFSFKQAVTNPYAEGQYASIYKYNSENPIANTLRASFKEKYGVNPDVEVYVAMTYDAYNILRNVAGGCAKHDSNCIRDSLYKVKNYQGASGQITIDSNGDTYREFILKKISNQTLVDF